MRSTTTPDAQPENLAVVLHYVWSARYIDAPVLRDRLTTGQRLYYLGDANFNVTTLVDTGGDAVERYEYDPYGKVTIYTGDWSSSRSWSLDNNVYLYTGHGASIFVALAQTPLFGGTARSASRERHTFSRTRPTAAIPARTPLGVPRIPNV
jgi:hypothetical protein